jgi:SOS-response transcriptional repressor LexA
MPKDIMTTNKKAHHDERLGWVIKKPKTRPLKDGLTPKQLKVYNVIKDFINANDHSPSYEEIKQLLGYNSKCPVHGIVHRLANRGWIRLGNGRNRSISIV